MDGLYLITIARSNGIAGDLPSLKARTRLMPLVFAVVTVALSSNADAGACGNNLSAFEWEMSSRPLPVVGAGPNFPPGREAETLLVVSSRYRAAQSMERLGNMQQCLKLVAEARTNFESLTGDAPSAPSDA